MAYNQWVQVVNYSDTDGTALTNTTTATSILPGVAKYTLPAGYLQKNSKVRVRAAGRISTAASTPGTLTLDVRFGSVVVFNGGASGTLATSASNVTWIADIYMTTRAVGASTTANLMGTGQLLTAALSTTTPIMLLPTSSPAVGTGFDSTSSQIVDFFATWSAASASNTITLHEYSLYLEN